MNLNVYEFRWIFLIFRRWLWLIIILAVLAGAGAFFITKQLPPTYKASVTLFVEQSGDTQASDYTALMGASRLALTYSEMIKGPSILNNIIKDLGLNSNTSQLANKITVEPIQNTQLIQLTVEDESPERTADIANSLARSFVEYIRSSQSERYSSNIARLQTKLTDLDNKIANDQSEINQLQIQELTNSSELAQSQSSLDEVRSDSRLLEQNAYNIQLTMAQLMANVKVVQTALPPENRPSIPYKATVLLIVKQDLGSSSNSSSVIDERLIGTYTQILQSHDVLGEVINQLYLNQSIDAIRKKISVEPVKNTQLIQLSVMDNDAQLAINLANSLADAFVKQMQASLTSPYSSQIENINSQLSQLNNEEETYKKQIEALSSTRVELESELSRLQNMKVEDQNTHQATQAEYDRLRQLASDAADSVYITEPANIPSKPSTNTRLYLIFSVILGGVLGFVIAFLLEYLNDTIRSVADLPKELGLDILGKVSELNNAEDSLVTVSKPLSPISEGFTVLANNLRFATLNQPVNTIIVTSPSANEGKSFVMANLAVTMTQLEQTVVAVDADLRLPTLHKVFGVKQEGGLTDALVWGSPDGWLTDVKVNGLQVLPSGKLPVNPIGALGSARMHSLLDELRRKFNLVLIDCPPVLPVADASMLASMSDGVILVIRINHTHKRAMRDTLLRLKQVGAKVIGVVINALPAESEGYYAYAYQKAAENKFTVRRIFSKEMRERFNLFRLFSREPRAKTNLIKMKTSKQDWKPFSGNGSHKEKSEEKMIPPFIE